MLKYRLAFTEEEEALLSRIDLRPSHRNHDGARVAYLGNMEPVPALLRSLGDRGAIPAHRVSYWNDPTFRSGRLKGSRKQLFERNGCFGEDIYTHPNFVRHLRYILLGADLPDEIVLAFEQEVGNPEWVSYGDALDLGRKARALTRRHGLDASAASEEFFKLALDLGLSADSAMRIAAEVKATR
jgi:hypothetical protein